MPKRSLFILNIKVVKIEMWDNILIWSFLIQIQNIFRFWKDFLLDSIF